MIVPLDEIGIAHHLKATHYLRLSLEQRQALEMISGSAAAFSVTKLGSECPRGRLEPTIDGSGKVVRVRRGVASRCDIVWGFHVALFRLLREIGKRTDTEKLPIEIVAGTGSRRHMSEGNPGSTLIGRALNRGTDVGAGWCCHPTNSSIIARFAFLYILSGQGRPVARL